MANQANIGRKTTADLLGFALHTLRITAGLLLKAYRSYKRAGAPQGYTQEEIATSTGVPQSQISRLETGKPAALNNQQLKKVLTACGFDLTSESGIAFFSMLKFLTDYNKGLEKLKKDRPKLS